ncbi:hypothetical protein [Cognatilysobacter lacus]|uniref:DUF4124 domain-containing protein n=1 Tax=Cognatilysobacter lacus TaxID=1643323 RepID=A0A5D8Z5T2_9GAMM|nr:hypothetical protein [Lysobacter lacus]TZF90109.1 hypothetical protein FW784_06560 [Lysobacter lacus]
MPRRLLLAPLLLFLAMPRLAPAQVRRCAMADGSTVFTDQRCDVIGAVERAAPANAAAAAPQLRSYRPGCPRTLRDLAYEVSSSVEAHDVNRLASVYLWNGMGTREGYKLMDRLQAVVDRPLVDIQAVWPGASDDPYPAAAPAGPPVALRLEQTSSHGSTPMHAVFGLRKHLDCWWIVEGGAPRAPRPAPAAPAIPTQASPPAAVPPPAD